MFLRESLKKGQLWLAGLILLIALILRVWGLEFGLPYIYHYDEHFYINTALKLGAGILHNPPYAPTGFSNILFGVYGGYFVIGKLLGLFASGAEFEAAFRSDPMVFYILGRSTSALLGVAAVLALFVLGKSVSKPVTGLLAAGLLTASFLHVRDSHYAVPDIAMGTFVIWAVALAAVGLQYQKRNYIYLAALAGGLATAMKWTGLPVIVAVGWASLWVGAGPKQSFIRRLFNSTVVLAILLFALGFALGSPQLLLYPTLYIEEAVRQSSAGEAGGFDAWVVDTLPGWLFYGKTLLYGVGIVLLALGAVGIVRRAVLAAKTGDRVSILILLFPLLYYLLMGSTRHYFARYVVPLTPFVAFFAAEAIVMAVDWLKIRRARPAVAVGIILLVIALTQPLVQSIRHDILLTRQDSRTLAKQWIEAHLPERSKIAMDWETHGPPLSTPEKVMPYSDRLYNLSLIGGTGLSEYPLAWYREQKFDYLITTSFISNIRLVNEERDAERRAFYSSLDQYLELVQEFHPYTDSIEPPFIFDEIYGPAISLWQRERPGPTIKVYKLDLRTSK